MRTSVLLFYLSRTLTPNPLWRPDRGQSYLIQRGMQLLSIFIGDSSPYLPHRYSVNFYISPFICYVSSHLLDAAFRRTVSAFFCLLSSRLCRFTFSMNGSKADLMALSLKGSIDSLKQCSIQSSAKASMRKKGAGWQQILSWVSLYSCLNECNSSGICFLSWS